MTDQMLKWSIEHYSSSGKSRFKLDRRFQRAAAQHYHAVFWHDHHYIHLIPPHIARPDTDYEIQIEAEQ